MAEPRTWCQTNPSGTRLPKGELILFLFFYYPELKVNTISGSAAAPSQPIQHPIPREVQHISSEQVTPQAGPRP
ncbi:hypothetical protein XA68_10870 [Ophiocordyceps unilateralis]|uniref:Uncharacterized protein n=1 Tax=Ophiocordyceps unilateralis TaxID=268505 RepID=A0A2A9PHW9_OPHUN|nr:hypothetical protein XA68_10870 [Ophiocordyceps unilateralis]